MFSYLKRIKASKVWIQPMTPCNIDLAKNLILAGINITIFDNEKITTEDLEDNPLIIQSDIGKNVRWCVFLLMFFCREGR